MQVDIIAELLTSSDCDWRFWYATKDIFWLVSLADKGIVLAKNQHAISMWNYGQASAYISLEFPMCYITHRREFTSLSELPSLWPCTIKSQELKLIKLIAEYQPSEWEEPYGDWPLWQLKEHLLGKAP